MNEAQNKATVVPAAGLTQAADRFFSFTSGPEEQFAPDLALLVSLVAGESLTPQIGPERNWRDITRVADDCETGVSAGRRCFGWSRKREAFTSRQEEGRHGDCLGPLCVHGDVLTRPSGDAASACELRVHFDFRTCGSGGA